jgi:predicted type IV restriction endonuclease
VVDAIRDVVGAAMEQFIAREALARFGYAPKDLVKAPLEKQEANTSVPLTTVEPQEDVVTPSDTELAVFTFVRNRLIYLCRNEVLFKEVEKVAFKKTKGSFRVFYAKPNNGSLFDYREQKDGKVVLHFPVFENAEIPYQSGTPELDDYLLRAFTQRVAEAGISFQPTSVLRAIDGGQSGAA